MDSNRNYLAYIPLETHSFINDLLKDENVKILVKKSRKGKWGDFRPANKEKIAIITVNNDLLPIPFFLTLVHEIAHLKTRNIYGKKALPHGNEWKDIFRKLCYQLLELNLLSLPFSDALRRHIINPKSSICYDAHLMKLFQSNDEASEYVMLGDVSLLQSFELKNRAFIRQEKLRSRSKCIEIATKRMFFIHNSAQVKLLINN